MKIKLRSKARRTRSTSLEQPSPVQVTELEEIARKHGPRYALDLAIPCPGSKCGAGITEPCHELPVATVHFGRRLAALMRGLR